METILMVFNMTLVNWVIVCKFPFNFMAFHVKHHKNVFTFISGDWRSYYFVGQRSQKTVCGSMTSSETSVVFAKTQGWNKLSWTLVILQILKREVKHIFRSPLRRTDLQQKDLSLRISKESDKQYSCSSSQKWWVCSQSRLVNLEGPFSNVEIQIIWSNKYAAIFFRKSEWLQSEKVYVIIIIHKVFMPWYVNSDIIVKGITVLLS